MVIAYHLILSAYGFWLPNDERGSWSDFVRAYELLVFGPATKVDTRQSVAHRPYDPNRRRMMREALQFEPVLFDGRQAKSIAEGFAYRALKSKILIHACAILPDHVHIVFLRHRMKSDQEPRSSLGNQKPFAERVKRQAFFLEFLNASPLRSL